MDPGTGADHQPSYRLFLRTTPGGLLRIDPAAARAEERLDGKFLLRTSDPTLSVEDVALGYKQLLEMERAWRDVKSTLDIRPVYHHLQPPPRARPDAPRRVLRQRRTRSAAHRDHDGPTRDPRCAGAGGTEAVPRHHPRNRHRRL